MRRTIHPDEDDDQVNDDGRQQLTRDIQFGLVDVDAGRVVSDEELKRHFEAKFGAIEWG
jgi:hypothetical protein